MLEKIDRFLLSQSQNKIILLSLFLVLFIGVIDHITGFEISFSIFYLLPVGLASWYLKKSTGLIICLLSAATWYYVDFVSGHYYSNSIIPVWNASVRLGFFIIVSTLLSNLRQTLLIQESLALTDGLTGIPNARSFKQKCSSFFDLAFRYKRTLALGYIDLDGFKSINDKLGHTMGDQVLKEVAKTMSNRLRASDVCSRLGGDEFAVLLPETDTAGAQLFFNELHKSLMEMAELNKWPVGFSIGVAVFKNPAANPDAAVKLADNLMYSVKNSGKNRILLEEFS